MNTTQTALNDLLASCSYTDFVGLVAQTNVPPGSYSTLSQWAVYSRLTEDSHLMEVACTTGFSLRELARMVGCTGEGADISALSVATASRWVKGAALEARLRYQAHDAVTYKPDSRPTHIVLGAALGFFPEPQRMLNRCMELLGDSGYVLASPFYAVGGMPESLLQEAEQVLGIRPTAAAYKEVMAAYRGLTLVYENRQSIEMETEEELHHYCSSTARRAMSWLGENNDTIQETIYRRLYSIKELCNRLRPYQGYSVLVLRYDRTEYPNRYVELF